jgi:AhpD family alkylhydroperoxidase
MSEKPVNNMPLHWQILDGQDPELNVKIQAWREHVFAREGLPRYFKELLMVAMSCVTHNDIGVKAHGQAAIKYGASKEAFLDTILQAMFVGGIPAYRSGAYVFKELFPEEK